MFITGRNYFVGSGLALESENRIQKKVTEQGTLPEVSLVIRVYNSWFQVKAGPNYQAVSQQRSKRRRLMPARLITS